MSCPRNTSSSNLPVRNELAVLFGPGATQVSKRRMIEYVGDRLVHTLPHLGEGRIGAAVRAVTLLLDALHKTQYLSDCQGFRRARQQVSAFRAPARFHKPALFKTGENELQKFLGNLLAPCNIGDLDRLTRILLGKIEQRLQSILPLYRD